MSPRQQKGGMETILHTIPKFITALPSKRAQGMHLLDCDLVGVDCAVAVRTSCENTGRRVLATLEIAHQNGTPISLTAFPILLTMALAP
jgi:hypothetical protein